MEKLAGASARPVTGVRVLRDGAVAFPAMLELIAGAKREVLFENFIFAADATGLRFAASLAAAAARGVDVRVLYDPVGTLMVRGGSIARQLKKDRVKARAFRPLSPFSPWTWLRLRHRDHRKVLVVDGEVAVVGGLCISDHWAPSRSGGAGWRDTALLVRGPVAADVKSKFDGLWWRIAEEIAAAPDDAAAVATPPLALLVADRPSAHHVANVYEWLANTAERSLDITDAYLVAPKRVLAAFENAARRGVEVRLLLPGRSNHPVAAAAARRGYESLLDAGVHIYEWKGVMVHAKTMVADGRATLVGSSNLDPLSLRRNYELNLLIDDVTTGAAMRSMFVRDLAESVPIDLIRWRQRSYWLKWGERVAGVFASNL